MLNLFFFLLCFHYLMFSQTSFIMQYPLYIIAFLCWKNFPSPFHIFIHKFCCKSCQHTSIAYNSLSQLDEYFRDDEKFPSIKSGRVKRRENWKKIAFHHSSLSAFYSTPETSSMCLIKIVNESMTFLCMKTKKLFF